MKALKLVPIIAAFVFASCNKDKDEAPVPVGPQISYEQTKFTVPFFTQADSGIPTLQWNGEVGNLSLSNSISGIHLNEANGVLTFRKSMPLGQSTMTVIATNSIGQDAVTFEINNEFQGSFDGGYNNNPASEVVTSDLKINFDKDGTTVLTESGDIAPGTWTREGKTITAVYSINGGANFVTIKGDLTYNGPVAKLKGFYYQGEEAVDGNEGGFIHVDMD